MGKIRRLNSHRYLPPSALTLKHGPPRDWLLSGTESGAREALLWKAVGFQREVYVMVTVRLKDSDWFISRWSDMGRLQGRLQGQVHRALRPRPRPGPGETGFGQWVGCLSPAKGRCVRSGTCVPWQGGPTDSA